MDFISYEYIVFIQMQNGSRRKDVSKTMVIRCFHHFCMVWSLFSQILSTFVKCVDLQVRVITILAGSYLSFLGPVNAKL